MQSEPSDELRVLRERAYGPHADIQDDRAAVSRLHELEIANVAAAPEPGSVLEVVEGGLPLAQEPQGVETELTPSTDTSSPKSSILRWRFAAVWVVSLVLTANVAVAISASVIQRVQVDPQNVGATQEARLGADSGRVAGDFFGAEARVFAEFHGLTVVVPAVGIFAGSSNDECVLVMTTDGFDSATANSFSSQIYSGCAANEFPATVAFKVTADMPDELKGLYAEGTALQFVYDEAGSDVVVYAGTPALTGS